MKYLTKVASIICMLILNTGCNQGSQTQEELLNSRLSIDTLIINGDVYIGNSTDAMALDVAICGQNICGLFPTGKHVNKAKQTIDATGLVVSPGFIDPHTHSLEELLSQDKNHNLNYLSQGVTTVINGNDGGGPVDIKKTALLLESNGIGTNTALLVGHGSLRQQVIGTEQRFATPSELAAMSALLDKSMNDGAIGLSSGLYYVPGAYANTEEVVTLAKVAGRHNGVYDTHLRDESTFNIGLVEAVKEAIDIARQANIHLHIAHIKALGVDVWGKSKDVISTIESAQSEGLSISADQYPWLASGTYLRSAVMPKWVMADSTQAFHQRLNNQKYNTQLEREISENIRRRGGPDSLLITAFKDDPFVGRTLAQVSKDKGLSVVETVKFLVQEGRVRVASFNMSVDDVERFMVQPWVMTSSDGTNGHPRKYASFAKKYYVYVKQKKLISLASFIENSSYKTAKTLGLEGRGKIAKGFKADVIIFDPQTFKHQADFSKWNVLSSGMKFVFVNGVMTIKDEKYLGVLPGQFIH